MIENSISISYTQDREELSEAIITYMYNRTFMRFAIGAMIFFCVLMILFYIAALATGTSTIMNAVMFAIAVIFILLHRTINRWLISQRIKSHPDIGLTINILIDKDNISWQGQGLPDGTITWDNLVMIVTTNKGYLLCATSKQFLWVPYNAFDVSSKLQFTAMIEEKGIPIKKD